MHWNPSLAVHHPDVPSQLARLVHIVECEGVKDSRVLDAMRRVDRALFVPEALRYLAYENEPLPIGCGQTISQPLVVGVMTAALQVEPSSTVLEVGTGSGYQAAILAELCKQVITVERHKQLADDARDRLLRLGYSNVQAFCGDGSTGWPAEAPYDRILVTAGAPRIPVTLVARLAKGGRIVVPVGSLRDQELIALEKGPEGLVEQHLGSVRFVPLIGQAAWTDGLTRAES